MENRVNPSDGGALGNTDMYHRLLSRYFDISRVSNLVRFETKSCYVSSRSRGLRFDYENSGRLYLTEFVYSSVLYRSKITTRFNPEKVVVYFKNIDDLNKEFFMFAKKLEIYHAGLDADIEALEARIKLQRPHPIPGPGSGSGQDH